MDLNSYFASVEQQLRPELRGKPVAVVPLMADTTCAIAASYEAKAFGVKTGTLVRDAKRMCPGLILVEARHEPYVEIHHKILEALESCIPIDSVLSIDEAACRLTGSQREPEVARVLALKIKSTISSRVGEYLKCSIGLAPNRFLAKVAADMQKPDGLTTILPLDLPEKLFPLKIDDFPGIGPRMKRRFERMGIFTTKQILALSVDEMRAIWGGIVGERFWKTLQGEEVELPASETHSIGHSHVLPPEMRNAHGSYLIAQKLLHKAAVRLRRKGYWARGMSVSIRFLSDYRESGGGEWAERSSSSAEAKSRIIECQDTLTLIQILENLWKKALGSPEGRAASQAGRPLKVGVTLYDLIEERFHTESLFEDRKRVEVSKAMDRVNEKYGRYTLYFAGIHENVESAPTRIAFSRIPEFD